MSFFINQVGKRFRDKFEVISIFETLNDEPSTSIAKTGSGKTRINVRKSWCDKYDVSDGYINKGGCFFTWMSRGCHVDAQDMSDIPIDG